MANAMLDAALDYAERGWLIFPCNAIKEPYTTNGVLDASNDPKQIKKWWDKYPRANIGLDVGGMGWMVLDLDPGHDRDDLDDAVGGLPKTQLRQRTPRGGEHLFYELEDGEIVAPSVGKIAKKVDVRSFHSYVLLAPSRTGDGKYEWEGEGKPAFRTDEMVRVANVAKEKSKDRDNWLIEADLPENVKLATDWLKKDAKIATQGDGGDHTAYATAAMMKSFGLSQELAFDLMWEHWNPRCNPPWDADEIDHLETKVKNGYSYNTSPPGNMTPAYGVAKTAALFNAVQAVELPTGQETISGRFRFVDREGMTHIRPPEWLIKDFIPQGGSCILFGTRGTFKTFIALDIALSIASGGSFPWEGVWGSDGVADMMDTGPVLFAAGEGRDQLTKRVTAWEMVHNQNRRVDNFVMGDPVPHVSEDIEPFIAGALELSPKGYLLVVVDTIGRSMQGMNENSQEHASKYTALVEKLQRGLDCAVLSLHHTGYDNAGRTRGSSVFEADADTVIRLDRPDMKAYTVSLSMTKQKDAEEWQEPRYLRLQETHVSVDRTSLVAVKATKADLPKKGVKKVDAEHDAAWDVVHDAAIAHLSEHPAKKFSFNALANAIAMRDEVEVSSQSIRRRMLRPLMEDKKRKLGTYWDKSQDAFIYRV